MSESSDDSFHLDKEHQKLQHENATLRAQLEDSVAISRELDALQDRNNKLLALVRSVTAERDDIAQRLEISLTGNREAANKLAEEQRSNASMRQQALESSTQEIEKVKRGSRAQIDSLVQQVEDLQQQVQQQSSERKRLELSVDRIVRQSSQYFEQDIYGIDDLSAIFQQPKLLKAEIPVGPSPSSSDSRVRKLKSKLKTVTLQKSRVESELADVRRSFQELQSSSRQNLASLQGQLDRTNTANAQLECQNRSTIANLESRIEYLKADLGRAVKEAKKPVAPLPVPEPPKVEPPPREPGQAIVNQQLLSRIEDLSNQLKYSQAKRSELSDKLQQAETGARSFELALAKQQQEFTAISIVNNEKTAEIEALRAALHSKTQPEPVPVPRSDASEQVAKLEKCLSAQTQKVYTLEYTIAKQKTDLDDQCRQMRALEAKNHDLEGAVESAKAEAREAQFAIATAPDPAPAQVIPASAFRLSVNDPELVDLLSKIGNSDALQPGSKVQNALGATERYFTREIQKRDRALDEAFADNQRLGSIVNQFLVDISISVANRPITLDDFLKGGSQTLAKAIKQLRQDHDAHKHNWETQTALVNPFTDTFKANFASDANLEQRLAAIKAAFESQTAKINSQARKIRSLKSALELTKSETSSKINNLEEAKRTLEKDVEDLSTANAELGDKLSASECQERTLAVKYETAVKEHKRATAALSKEHDDTIAAFEQSRVESEAVLNSKINEISAQCGNLNAKVAANERQIAGLEAQLQAARQATRRATGESEQLQKDSASKEAANAALFQEQKRMIEETYQNALAELREQCEVHRSDIEKLSASLSQSEAAAAASMSANLQLEREKKHTIAEVQQLIGQLETEKRLAEARIRAAKVSAESEYAVQLEEQRSQAEGQLRSAFAIAIDAFRSFFNASESLNERTFKQVIGKAKDELARLAKADQSIRRIVRAIDHQTTEDAVAQSVLYHGLSDY
jgi:chromosome segregation ATPase